MYKIRPLDTPSIQKHNTYPQMQVLPNYADVPLKDVDFSKRWCSLPQRFEGILNDLANFKVRTDDIFVITFMKSGTTWMQEAAWLILNDMDFATAKSVEGGDRCPFIEVNGLLPIKKNKIEEANKMKSPRLLKSHLPSNMMPKELWEKKPKIIYVARNVKDTLLSNYHFLTGLGDWKGTIEEYIYAFTNEETRYTPYWEHLIDFWRLRHEPYMYYTTYEEMQRDLGGVLQGLAKFLNKPALSDEQIQMAKEHLSFDKMKVTQSMNPSFRIRGVRGLSEEKFEFMRRGVAGGYKDELSEKQCQYLDDWSKKCLEKYGLTESDLFQNV